MSHVCTMNSELDAYNNNVYTCGSCGKTFATICILHQHITCHNGGGAYHYDAIVKFAFPKYDTTCSSTQTDEKHTNFLHHLEFARKFTLVSKVKVEVAQDDGASLEHDSRSSNGLGGGTDSDGQLVGIDRIANIERRVQQSAEALLCNKNETLGMRKCSVMLNKLGDENVDALVAGRSSTTCAITFPDTMNHTRKRKIEQENTKEIVQEHEPEIETTKHHTAFLPGKHVLDKVINCYDDGVDYLVSLSSKNMDKNKQSNNEIKAIPDFKIPKVVAGRRNTINVPAFKSETNPELKQYMAKNKNHRLKQTSSGHTKPNEKDSSESNTGKSADHDIECEGDLDKEKTELELKETYFFGMIISDSYVIRRARPKGTFYKGEQDENNRVFVTDTWIPDGQWTVGEMTSIKTETDDEDEIETKANNDFEIPDAEVGCNKLGKEEIRKLKRKHKCRQISALICSLCGKVFKSREHFAGHMNLHAGMKPFMCQLCGKSYSTLSRLHTHQQHVHSDKNSWYKCSICERGFPTVPKLRSHMDMHSTDYVHICRTCNKSYKSEKNLKSHVQFAHNKKQFKCKNCKASFNTQMELAIHHNDRHEGTRVMCKTCGRCFHSVTSRYRHEKIHSGEKPHECHICLRRFLQKTPYWVHMEKHHDLTKANLIELFPEKHMDKNKRHILLKEIKPLQRIEGILTENMVSPNEDIDLLAENNIDEVHYDSPN